MIERLRKLVYKTWIKKNRMSYALINKSYNYNAISNISICVNVSQCEIQYLGIYH